MKTLKLRVFDAYRNDFGEVKDEILIATHEVHSAADALDILARTYGQSGAQFTDGKLLRGTLGHRHARIGMHVGGYERVGSRDQCCEEITVREKKFILIEEISD